MPRRDHGLSAADPGRPIDWGLPSQPQVLPEGRRGAFVTLVGVERHAYGRVQLGPAPVAGGRSRSGRGSVMNPATASCAMRGYLAGWTLAFPLRGVAAWASHSVDVLRSTRSASLVSRTRPCAVSRKPPVPARTSR